MTGRDDVLGPLEKLAKDWRDDRGRTWVATCGEDLLEELHGVRRALAAVLHDDATVEAVICAILDAPTNAGYEAEARSVLAVLAERLGVPHVDR